MVASWPVLRRSHSIRTSLSFIHLIPWQYYYNNVYGAIYKELMKYDCQPTFYRNLGEANSLELCLIAQSASQLSVVYLEKWLWCSRWLTKTYTITITKNYKEECNNYIANISNTIKYYIVISNVSTWLISIMTNWLNKICSYLYRREKIVHRII